MSALGSYHQLGQPSSHLPRPLLAPGEVVVTHTTSTPRHSSSSSSPPPRPHSSSSSSSSFRPSIAFLVGFFTATMSSVAILLLLLYAKHRRGVAARQGRAAPAHTGVDREVVESLPVFRFGRGDAGLVECAVCLCGFRAGELLRELPKCKHAFHVACVDTWLASHSTCPLCRRLVDPQDLLLAFQQQHPPAGPKPLHLPAAHHDVGRGGRWGSSKREGDTAMVVVGTEMVGGAGSQRTWADVRPQDHLRHVLTDNGRQPPVSRPSDVSSSSSPSSSTSSGSGAGVGHAGESRNVPGTRVVTVSGGGPSSGPEEPVELSPTPLGGSGGEAGPMNPRCSK